MKNNSIKLTFSFFLFLSFLANCERNTLELPQTTGNNSDIELEMLVDGNPVITTAGIEDVFNDTDHIIGQGGVSTFSGTLTTVDCGSACPNSFTMRIRNFEEGITNFNVNQSIGLRSYKFKNDATPLSDAFILDLNINTQAIEPRPSLILEGTNIKYTHVEANDIRVLDIENTGEAFLKMSVLDEAKGLSSFYTRQLLIDNTNLDPVYSRIIVEHIEEDSVALSIVHSDSNDFIPLQDTQWGFTDLNGQNQQLITESKDEQIRLRIGNGKNIRNITNFSSTDNATRTTVGLEIKYDDNQGLIYDEVDFNYNIIERIDNGSALFLQTFEFVMVDENGVIFSSAKGEQNSNALFEVTHVESFIQNEKDQETVKIDCQFSCTLYADDGSQKNIQNAKATIALATP